MIIHLIQQRFTEGLMVYQPGIHTKEYLLNNITHLEQLIKNCPEFCESNLVEDLEFLKTTVDASGFTVAHLLAKNRPEWLSSKASKNIDVLKITDAGGWNTGWTVAHEIATQKEWLKSNEINRKDILFLSDRDGVCVAHTLADFQIGWSELELSKDFEVLTKQTNGGRSVAHLLASKNENWVKSAAAQSIEILKLSNNEGDSVAHCLARHQSEWVHSAEAVNLNVISIKNNKGLSVGHELARFQNEWSKKPIAHELQVLLLADNDGETIAHFLAKYRDQWCYTERGSDPEILKIKNNFESSVASNLADHLHWSEHPLAQDHSILSLCNVTKWSVAYSLASNVHWITTDAAFDKNILSLETNSYSGASRGANTVSVAQRMADKKLATLPEVAMRLISKGAAFKYSHALCETECIEEIIAMTEQLIADENELKLKLKFAVAGYSTISHFINGVQMFIPKDENEQNTQSELVEYLKETLQRSENIVYTLMEETTNEMDNLNNFLDINCEPGFVILQKYLSAKEFHKLSDTTNNNENETPTINGVWY